MFSNGAHIITHILLHLPPAAIVAGPAYLMQASTSINKPALDKKSLLKSLSMKKSHDDDDHDDDYKRISKHSVYQSCINSVYLDFS